MLGLFAELTTLSGIELTPEGPLDALEAAYAHLISRLERDLPLAKAAYADAKQKADRASKRAGPTPVIETLDDLFGKPDPEDRRRRDTEGKAAEQARLRAEEKLKGLEPIVCASEYLAVLTGRRDPDVFSGLPIVPTVCALGNARKLYWDAVTLRKLRHGGSPGSPPSRE